MSFLERHEQLPHVHQRSRSWRFFRVFLRLAGGVLHGQRRPYHWVKLRFFMLDRIKATQMTIEDDFGQDCCHAFLPHTTHLPFVWHDLLSILECLLSVDILLLARLSWVLFRRGWVDTIGAIEVIRIVGAAPLDVEERRVRGVWHHKSANLVCVFLPTHRVPYLIH